MTCAFTLKSSLSQRLETFIKPWKNQGYNSLKLLKPETEESLFTKVSINKWTWLEKNSVKGVDFEVRREVHVRVERISHEAIHRPVLDVERGWISCKSKNLHSSNSPENKHWHYSPQDVKYFLKVTFDRILARVWISSGTFASREVDKWIPTPLLLHLFRRFLRGYFPFPWFVEY